MSWQVMKVNESRELTYRILLDKFHKYSLYFMRIESVPLKWKPMGLELQLNMFLTACFLVQQMC